MLHSSYPSTDGYGIQEFELPSYAWFVRLNAINQFNIEPISLALSKTVKIDKIDIIPEDKNFHVKKILLVQNGDTLTYRKFRKKSLVVERDQGLELLLIGKSDTLRIKRLEEAFNYEKEFSISVQIPKKHDDCYVLFYLSENNEETSFELSLQDGSVFKKKGKHECVMIYVSSRILKFEPYKN